MQLSFFLWKKQITILVTINKYGLFKHYFKNLLFTKCSLILKLMLLLNFFNYINEKFMMCLLHESKVPI